MSEDLRAKTAITRFAGLVRAALPRRAAARRHLLTVESLESRETPAALHWIGGAGANSNLWSIAANWQENTVPVSGSALVFDTSTPGFSATAKGLAPTNDLFGLSNLTMTFNDASSAGDFNVSGSPISLRSTAGIGIDSTVTSGTGVTVALNMNLAAHTTIKSNLGALALNGIITDGSDSFALNAVNTATTTINLGGANSYDGGTTINAGTLGVGAASSLGTGVLTMAGGTLVNLSSFFNITNPFVINGPSTVGGGGFFHLDGNGILNADLTVTNNGFFEMNGALSGPAGIISNTFPGNLYLGGTQPNSFTGASSIVSGVVFLRKPSGVTAWVAPVAISGSFSSLRLEADNQIADTVAIALASGGSLNLDTRSDSILSLNGATGTLNPGAGLSILGGGNQSFAGAVQGTGPLIYSGQGTLTLSGASPNYTGTLNAANGILAVSGNFPAAPVVVSAGTLGGTGVVKSVMASQLTVVGYVEPGGPKNIGILTMAAGGSSSLSGLTYRVDLNDIGNNDRLVLGNGAAINLDGSLLDFAAASSAPGNVYTIISSPSGGISGTFSGLPKGAFIVKSGQTFQINYSSTTVTLSHLTYGVYPASPLFGVVGIPYSQTLAVAAGTPPYSDLSVTAFNGGSTGLTSSNITADPAANTVAINGTASATGVVTFTVHVTDNSGITLNKNYAINFNGPPSFAPATLADGAFGTAYNQVISVVDGAPPLTSLTVTNFNAGGTGLTAPTVNVSAGTVTFASSPTAPGAVTFTLSTVDSAGAAGTKTYSINITKAGSRVNLTSSLGGGALAGQPITFTAAVSPAPPAVGTASGSVTFFDGATQIGSGTLNTGGIATLQTGSFSVGAHSITAVYAGNVNLTGSTSNVVTQSVTKANSTTTLTSNANPSVFGQAVTFTATVRPVAPGVGVPAGSVTLFDGGAPIATAPIDAAGTAIFQVPGLSAGAHPIAAIFVGNASFNGSTSTLVDQVVTDSGPRVESVTHNGNIPQLAGAQRSRIASLVVVFNRPVTLDLGALTLALHTNNVVYGGVSQPGGMGVVPTALNISTADNVTWIVTFSGNTDVGVDGFASLKDGVYDFKIDAAKVHPAGAPGVNMSTSSTTTFHRLFGDVDAPVTPSGGTPGADFAATVSSVDNLAFRGAFNNANNYKAFLDFTGDGAIGSSDNLQFRNRFNKSLTWRA